jgi:hypothetical protein
MDINSKGFWLLPTRGRVTTKLPRFFRLAKATGLSTPGIILVNDADFKANHQSYLALELPHGWSLHISKHDSAAEKTAEGVKEFMKPDVEWVGWLGDDLIPETQDWDKKVIEALNGWNCVSTNDGHQRSGNFTGAQAWSADLIRAVGYIVVDGTKHFYLDTMWMQLGKLVPQCWVYLADTMVRHKNADWNWEEKDDTSEAQRQHWDNDDPIFADWRQKELLPAAERIVQLMEAKGVAMSRPDLSGRRIMIATPSMEGKFGRLYFSSFINTWNYIKQFGGEPIFAEMPYLSDPVIARTKLFGMFLRSNCTDCLWIDDDMGWNPESALQILLVKRDFVAVAGPRKVFPPSFAATITDEFGNLLPIDLDKRTGFVRNALVGMAFVTISHHCAVRMAQMYKDLEFVAADGRTETGVFLPMILNRRYLSEDFAFCRRWMQIGGETLVASEIPLSHTGEFTWSGSWLDNLIEKGQMEQEQAKREAA